MYYETGKIDTLADLMLAIQDCLTGGYDNIEYEVKPRNDEPHIIIDVRLAVFSEHDSNVIHDYIPGLLGEFCFDQHGKVMHVR